MSTALADSLASALSRLPGLTAEVAEASAPVYAVLGDLSVRDGRLVIAARLYEGSRTEPLWSSTFWRRAELDTELVNDLAQGVAEAVYGEVARRALAKGRNK